MHLYPRSLLGLDDDDISFYISLTLQYHFYQFLVVKNDTQKVILRYLKVDLVIVFLILIFLVLVDQNNPILVLDFKPNLLHQYWFLILFAYKYCFLEGILSIVVLNTNGKLSKGQ